MTGAARGWFLPGVPAVSLSLLGTLGSVELSRLRGGLPCGDNGPGSAVPHRQHCLPFCDA